MRIKEGTERYKEGRAESSLFFFFFFFVLVVGALEPARYIYYSGTKLLPVEATILADDHRNEIIRVPFAPSRNRLGPIPYHASPAPADSSLLREIETSSTIPRQRARSFNDYSRYNRTFFSSLRAKNRIDRIRNPNPKFRVSVSFNSPVIPILTDTMAIRSRRSTDKRDPFIKSSRPCRFSLSLLSPSSFFQFPATMMIHAEISRLD